MKRLCILFAATFLILIQGAKADDIASVVTATGVDVQASLEGDSRLVIAIVPTMDVKLNGQLGIGIKALDSDGPWLEELPSLHKVDGDYFNGAVLQTVTFDSEAMLAHSALGITYGACLPVSGVCILEEAELTLMRESDGSIGLTLAALQP